MLSFVTDKSFNFVCISSGAKREMPRPRVIGSTSRMISSTSPSRRNSVFIWPPPPMTTEVKPLASRKANASLGVASIGWRFGLSLWNGRWVKTRQIHAGLGKPGMFLRASYVFLPMMIHPAFLYTAKNASLSSLDAQS